MKKEEEKNEMWLRKHNSNYYLKRKLDIQSRKKMKKKRKGEERKRKKRKCLCVSRKISSCHPHPDRVVSHVIL